MVCPTTNNENNFCGKVKSETSPNEKKKYKRTTCGLGITNVFVNEKKILLSSMLRNRVLLLSNYFKLCLCDFASIKTCRVHPATVIMVNTWS